MFTVKIKKIYMYDENSPPFRNNAIFQGLVKSISVPYSVFFYNMALHSAFIMYLYQPSA